MFESLIETIPDLELGRQFRPRLAAGMPTMRQLSRDFSLVKNARWSGDGGRNVDARDILGTLELNRKIPQNPCSAGMEVFETEKIRIEHPFQLRLTYRQGVLEPLGRTTFKVVPARYLKANVKEANDELFSRAPFGSGPYRFLHREQESPTREAAVFQANPYYSQRYGKFGMPVIREIRFIIPNSSTAATDFANGQLHLILDVPTTELPRYVNDPLAGGLLKAHTLAQNRRIWMLAVNHARISLRNTDLRRGLAAAINREEVLNTVYRIDGYRNVHRSLNGPFPFQSWATPKVKSPKVDPQLFQKELAAGLLSTAAAQGGIQLSLKYNADDPLAARACLKIKDQVEACTVDGSGKPRVVLELQPLPTQEFYVKLYDEHDFDLAYCPYDYSDDLYFLGHLLDGSAGGRGGRNFLSYLAEGGSPQPEDESIRMVLDQLRSHRDFKESYRELTWKLHKSFLDRMPFIPLWQLDRHIIVHQSVEMHRDSVSSRLIPETIDASRMLNGAEMWRLR